MAVDLLDQGIVVVVLHAGLVRDRNGKAMNPLGAASRRKAREPGAGNYGGEMEDSSSSDGEEKKEMTELRLEWLEELNQSPGAEYELPADDMAKKIVDLDTATEMLYGEFMGKDLTHSGYFWDRHGQELPW